MSIVALILVVAGLLLLNGTCVAAELALAGAPRSRLESMARAGSRGARRVLEMIGSFRALDRAVATAQAGITLSSLGLGMFVEASVAALLEPLLAGWVAGSLTAHGLASVLALILLTYLHVVLGEVVPKTLALQQPVRVALLLQAPLRAIEAVLAPLVFLLDRASTGVIRLLQVRPAVAEEHAHTLEEIQSLLEESTQEGAVSRRQTRMLRNLLDFEDLLVRKVLVPRTQVVGLPTDATAAEILAILQSASHTRYPVFEHDLDHIIGFVHARQLLGVLEPGRPFDLRAIVRRVPMVPETARARRLLRLFRDQQVHIAVVLDEHGGTAGIATLQDLLEEIFGEVQDEFDREEPAIHRVSATTALLRGSVRLDEIRDELGIELEGRRVDTVAGLVLEKLGRTARRGDRVVLPGATLIVEDVKGLAVSRVRMELDEPAPSAG